MLPRNVQCDPRFAPHDRRRKDWMRKRRAELHELTGGVSYGVGAMIASAAWLYAGGEYAAERAAETGDVDLFRTAATLTSTARQHDLASWELAVREGEARRRARPRSWRDRQRDQLPEPVRPSAAPAKAADAEAVTDAQTAAGGHTSRVIDTNTDEGNDDA